MVESATVKSLYFKVRQADVLCHRTRTDETGQYLCENGVGKSEIYQKFLFDPVRRRIPNFRRTQSGDAHIFLEPHPLSVTNLRK